MKNTQWNKIALTLASLILSIQAGCTGKSLDLTGQSLGGLEPVSKHEIEVTPPSGTALPVAMVTYDSVLSNMASLTQVTPSATTISLNERFKANFSKTGVVEDLNPAMMMAVATVAGSVCTDLYNYEKTRDTVNRIFYSELPLNGMANFTRVIDGKTVEVRIIEKMATIFWRRLPTSAEISEFLTAIDSVSVNRSNLGATNEMQALLILCTGALSALDAIKM